MVRLLRADPLEERIHINMSTNKRRRHAPEQIIRKSAQGNKHLGTGQFDEVYRHVEIAESTWHRGSPSKYGGMKANDAKRLKTTQGTEERNARLRKLLDDSELDKVMMPEIASGNF